MDFEKSDAAVTIEITYKKKFWIFEKSDAGGSREPKFFCPRPKLKINQTKITAYLEDKREISIPISELSKK